MSYLFKNAPKNKAQWQKLLQVRDSRIAELEAALSEQEAVARVYADDSYLGGGEIHVDFIDRANPPKAGTLLYVHQQPQKGETPQSVEEWIEENEIWNGCIPAEKVRDFMAGKALVPVEPTDIILEAGYRHNYRLETTLGHELAAECYKAMLEAAKGE